VTDAGQITLPEAIRNHLKLVGGSRVEFIIDEGGQVKLIPLNIVWDSDRPHPQNSYPCSTQ